MCTAIPVLIGRDPTTPPPPAFGLIYEGAIGQPRYATSIYDPLKPGFGININNCLLAFGFGSDYISDPPFPVESVSNMEAAQKCPGRYYGNT
jgi:hypothetical protein